MKTRDLTVAVLLATAGFAQPAFAYLDPSTGSMIVSAILGILASVGLALKTYWYRVKNFFGGNKGAQPEASVQQKSAETGEGREKPE